MTDKIVVINTCASADEAETLARTLIDQRLAACVTVISPAKSFYRWNGAVASSIEWLLLIKTSRALFARVETVLQTSHTYEVPEIIALPIVEGSTNYLAWLSSELLTAEVE
jgi:periplasmic divalent cation tolerance protein